MVHNRVIPDKRMTLLSRLRREHQEGEESILIDIILSQLVERGKRDGYCRWQLLKLDMNDSNDRRFDTLKEAAPKDIQNERPQGRLFDH